MIGGILLTHGEIGSALIGATASIWGQVDNIHAISTTELSLQDINTRLKQIIEMQNWQDGTIVMVSLIGGSCWNSALFLARQLPKIEVVSGVNLTMLLSFLSKRNRYSLSKLAETIKEDGIRGIERFALK